MKTCKIRHASLFVRVATFFLFATLGTPVVAQVSPIDMVKTTAPGVTVRDLGLSLHFVVALGRNTSTAASVPDALGSWYVPTNGVTEIGCNGLLTQRQEIIRQASLSLAETVATFGDACDGTTVLELGRIENVELDPINGVLLALANYFECDCSGANCSCSSDRDRVFEISGLPTLLDIIPTFDPNNTATLGWVAPLKPEAMAGSDGYSVYSGALDTVGDLSLATPLQCDLPIGRDPVPGEFLTVTDSQPVPQPGDGRYFLIANHFAGQTRAGRELTQGVLRGRDASVLSGCP